MSSDDFQAKMASNHRAGFPLVTGPHFYRLFNLVRDYTMCSVERLYDLYKSVQYVNAASIPGAIVEVGVWKGGALALAALTSTDESRPREILGFDTFAGHSEPDLDEKDLWGKSQNERWKAETVHGKHGWAAVGRDEVASNLARLGVEPSNVQLIEGDVVETAAHWAGGGGLSQGIAILRIDVDWYPATRASLEHLYPSLGVGGVLILDDYGHHSGAARAIDEYFRDKPMRFSHVDYSCIVAVKMVESACHGK